MKDLEKKYYSKEEYFNLIEESEVKYEYIDGQLRMMAGGTANHSLIASNLTHLLNAALWNKECSVFNSDMQLATHRSDRYFYPDVMVVCGDIDFEDNNQRRLKNPILIIEVLSESTKEFDRTEKFRYYSEIPSFKEYIMIYSDKIYTEGFYKEDADLWKICNAHLLDQKIQVHSLGIELNMIDLYHKTIDLEEKKDS